jgi:hypothetical protein
MEDMAATTIKGILMQFAVMAGMVEKLSQVVQVMEEMEVMAIQVMGFAAPMAA